MMRIRIPENISVADIVSRLKSVGYCVSCEEHPTSSYVWWDTQDGALFSHECHLYYDPQNSHWRFTHQNKTIACEEGTETFPAHDGACARNIEEYCALSEVHPWAAGMKKTQHITVENEDHIAENIYCETWHAYDPLREDYRVMRQHLVFPNDEQEEYTESCIECMHDILMEEYPADAFIAVCEMINAGKPGAEAAKECNIEKDDTIGRAIEKICHAQSYRMWANTRGAILDLHPEYVHDVRVSTRRLRWAFRLLKKYVGKDVASEIRSELKWIADILGAVRDCDVFIEWLKNSCENINVNEAVITTVTKRIHTQRGPIQKKLRDALQSSRYTELLETLQRFHIDEGNVENSFSLATPVCIASEDRIAHICGKVKKYKKKSPHKMELDELHSLRKKFKRIRYTCELFITCFGKKGVKLIDVSREMQDILGELNDARVAKNRLNELINNFSADATAQPDIFVALGSLHTAQSTRIEKQRIKAAEKWDKWPSRIDKLLNSFDTEMNNNK